jgi:hypothetical protein
MPYRSEVRTSTVNRALQQYGADKDPVALAKAVHGVLYDGLDITDAQQDQSGKVTITLSNGKTQSLSPDKLVQAAQYMRDPKAAAEYEAKTRWEMTKARIEAEGKIAVEERKGDIERETEGVRQQGRLTLEAARGTNQLREVGARNAGDLATAKVRTEGDIQVAKEKGNQERLTQKEKPKVDKSMRSDALQRLVINSGVGTPDPVTGQARGNADSNKVTVRAEQFMDANPDMSEADAVMHAVNEFRQRTAK